MMTIGHAKCLSVGGYGLSMKGGCIVHKSALETLEKPFV